jgi:bacteriochlorophyllide a dehydrogenase
MKAKAIFFEAPQSLSVRELELAPMDPRDLEVAVSFSGIGTGTERLQWEVTMPPFPGLSYPLVRGYETVGATEKIGTEVTGLAVGDVVFFTWLLRIPRGTKHLWRIGWAFGGAA